MQPTFNLDNSFTFIITNKMIKNYKKGDIVTFISPNDENSYSIKRITGVEGDLIKNSKDEWVLVPRGHVWVEGDNRFVSLDSNSYGPVREFCC
jgi:signal peptidase I